MSNEKSSLHYCIVLTPGQVAFLTDVQQGTSRCAVLLSLIQMATIEKADGDDNDGALVGQVNASIIGLADQWSINPKTARKLIRHFNEQGLIRTESSTLGSVHSILCLSGWLQNGLTIRSPLYQRPSAPNPSPSAEPSSEAVPMENGGKEEKNDQKDSLTDQLESPSSDTEDGHLASPECLGSYPDTMSPSAEQRKDSNTENQDHLPQSSSSIPAVKASSLADAQCPPVQDLSSDGSEPSLLTARSSERSSMPGSGTAE